MSAAGAVCKECSKVHSTEPLSCIAYLLQKGESNQARLGACHYHRKDTRHRSNCSKLAQCTWCAVTTCALQASMAPQAWADS